MTGIAQIERVLQAAGLSISGLYLFYFSIQFCLESCADSERTQHIKVGLTKANKEQSPKLA